MAVGAGGAIVLDSDPADEYEEMLLKAMATLRAYQEAPDPADDDRAAVVMTSIGGGGHDSAATRT